MNMSNPVPNWVHLDLKGMVPDEPRLAGWIDYLADRGFNGIVWEYEDRLPWRSWPGTFRPGLDLEAWQRIWSRCRSRGLEVVPLVQVQGHLAWVLSKPAWESWREDGHVNELCPQHPDVAAKLRGWLDEVIELHPGGRYLHLGADETWNLASCELCRAKASRSDAGKLAVYLEHVAALCEHVLARGVRPMIWADMFLREKRPDLAGLLPKGTILVDWQYSGAGPFPGTASLRASGLEVFGASSVRSSYEPKYTLGMLGPHLTNILGWHGQLARGEVAGLIHTHWCRNSSLGELYGPWEGWLPGFIAGGDPARWESSALRDAIPVLDRALCDPEWFLPDVIIRQLQAVPTGDGFEEAAVRWWALSLRHRVLIESTATWITGWHARAAVDRHRGPHPERSAMLFSRRGPLLHRMDEWETEARRFCLERGYGDTEEFLATKLGNLRAILLAADGSAIHRPSPAENDTAST